MPNTQKSQAPQFGRDDEEHGGRLLILDFGTGDWRPADPSEKVFYGKMYGGYEDLNTRMKIENQQLSEGKLPGRMANTEETGFERGAQSLEDTLRAGAASGAEAITDIPKNMANRILGSDPLSPGLPQFGQFPEFMGGRQKSDAATQVGEGLEEKQRLLTDTIAGASAGRPDYESMKMLSDLGLDILPFLLNTPLNKGKNAQANFSKRVDDPKLPPLNTSQRRRLMAHETGKEGATSDAVAMALTSEQDPGSAESGLEIASEAGMGYLGGAIFGMFRSPESLYGKVAADKGGEIINPSRTRARDDLVDITAKELERVDNLDPGALLANTALARLGISLSSARLVKVSAAFKSSNNFMIKELSGLLEQPALRKFRIEQNKQLVNVGEELGGSISKAPDKVSVGKEIERMIDDSAERYSQIHQLEMQEVSKSLGLGKQFEQAAIDGASAESLRTQSKALLEEIQSDFKNYESLLSSDFRKDIAILEDFAGGQGKNLTWDELVSSGVPPDELLRFAKGGAKNHHIEQVTIGFEKLRKLKTTLVKLNIKFGAERDLGAKSVRQLTADVDTAMYNTLVEQGTRTRGSRIEATGIADRWRKSNADMRTSIDMMQHKTLETIASKIDNLEASDVGSILARKPEWGQQFLDYVAGSGGDVEKARAVLGKGVWLNVWDKSIDAQGRLNAQTLVTQINAIPKQSRGLAFGEHEQSVLDFSRVLEELQNKYTPQLKSFGATKGEVMGTGMDVKAGTGLEANVLKSPMTAIGSGLAGAALAASKFAVDFFTNKKAAAKILESPDIMAEIMVHPDVIDATTDMLKSAILNLKRTGVPTTNPRAEVKFLRKLWVASPDAYKTFFGLGLAKTGKTGAIGAVVPRPGED